MVQSPAQKTALNSNTIRQPALPTCLQIIITLYLPPTNPKTLK